VKNEAGLSSTLEKDWWIEFPTFAKPEGVGSVYPSSVDYWQWQPTKAGPLVKRMRVLDYSGTFDVDDASRPWKKERAYSDVEIKFTVNHHMAADESVLFEFGDDTQSVKCTDGATKTEGNWKVTWSGTTATVARQVSEIVPGTGHIQVGIEVVFVMKAADFQCYLPENGLNPKQGDGAQGLAAALSLSKFLVKNIANDGRGLTGVVDLRYPVYKYQCLTQTIKASAVGYCTGDYSVRMCAVSDAAVSAFVVSRNLGNADGFGRLITRSPGGVPVYNKNVSILEQTGATMAEEMKNRCDALHNLACRFDDDPTALLGGYSTSTTRLDLLDEAAIKSICCADSPETREKDEAGIGNMATCISNADCDDIPSGESTFVSEDIMVAQAETVCCEYCQEFYGSIACVDAQGFRPDLVDGTGTSSANPGVYQPFIVNYCNDIVKCTFNKPCKGYGFGGTGITIPKVMDGPITIATLNGNGVTILPGDLDLGSAAGVSITATEINNPPALPAGMSMAGSALSMGPPGLTFNYPVLMQLGVFDPVAASEPGSSSESTNTTNSTRRVYGFNTQGLETGDEKVIIYKYVAGINPNNGDPAPEWMPVTATEQSTTINAFGTSVKSAKALITGFSMYAPLKNVDYPNMGPAGISVGPYGQTPSSAGKEIYIGFAAFFVILCLMYYIILLPKWSKEAPPPPPPRPQPAPMPEPPKPKMLPPPALPLSKPTYVQAEPVRFHHGTPIKHFGPTFDDIFDKEDLNWWAQEEAKADYNFPKLPFDPKADAQLGYNAR